MKTISLIFGIVLVSTTALFAQNLTTDTIGVRGKCGMCKNRIEQSATAVKGVRTANWDDKTQAVTITYEAETVHPDKVMLAIANAGHDTEKLRADKKAYNQLPGCCQYRQKDHKKGGKPGGCH